MACRKWDIDLKESKFQNEKTRKHKIQTLAICKQYLNEQLEHNTIRQYT